MIKMFEEDKVIIAPDLKVKDLQAKNMELDEIIEYAITKDMPQKIYSLPQMLSVPTLLKCSI